MNTNVIVKSVLFAAMVVLCGCASWVKYGASQAEIDQAITQCDYEARSNTHSTGFDGSFRRARLFDLCMKAKGFRKESPR